MTETPLLKEYSKPEENILSTKKTPEDIQKIIESHGIDIKDIIELKAIRDKMKMEVKSELKSERQKLMIELQNPEKPEVPEVPEVPETPSKPIDTLPNSIPGGTNGTGSLDGWVISGTSMWPTTPIDTRWPVNPTNNFWR